MKKLLFVLGFLFIAAQGFAQNNPSDEYLNRRWSGSLALGASVLNPNHQLNQIFEDHGFADLHGSWMIDAEYPQKYAIPSFEIEFAYLVQKQIEIGGAFMVSHCNIRGYNALLNKQLEINNTHFRFTPLFKLFSKNYYSHFQIGPSINIGEFYRTQLSSHTGPYADRYVRMGLMTGLGFSAFENPRSFLRVAVNYHILPGKVAIGPFDYIENPEAPPKSQVVLTAIPKEEMYLQELVIKVVYGFRFKVD